MRASAERRRFLLPAACYLLYAAVIAAYWTLFALAPDFHQHNFRGEDRVLEQLTFVSYFLAGAAVLWAFRYRRGMGRFAVFYLAMMALFYLVCAGEEISWGQRALGFATPESMLATNEQGEFNLHNLGFRDFRPITVVSAYMKLFGIALPLLLWRWTRRRDDPFRRYLSPPWLVPCFLWAELLSTFVKRLRPFILDRFGADVTAIVRSDTRELVEFYWGLSVMLASFAILAAWRRHAALAGETQRFRCSVFRFQRARKEPCSRLAP
jgi:hypothetical protein